MTSILSIICLAILVGCADSEDNASSNMRKGDEFLAKGEFEIAEYYYDKIPEESVLYKMALRKKQEIVKRTEVEEKESSTLPAVQVISHSFKVNAGKLPVHKVTIANNTDKRLQMVDLDFTYLDASGGEVKKMTSNVMVNLAGGDQKELSNISPGMISEKFTKVRVSISRTMFF